jgi:hypothetical protein
MESVLHLVKKLSNEIVDLKKNSGEGTSNLRTFRPFYRKAITSPKPPKPTNFNLNLEDVGMDNYYTYHHANHSKKTCPQWLHSMTLVENQFLDQQK